MNTGAGVAIAIGAATQANVIMSAKPGSNVNYVAVPLATIVVAIVVDRLEQAGVPGVLGFMGIAAATAILAPLQGRKSFVENANNVIRYYLSKK